MRFLLPLRDLSRTIEVSCGLNRETSRSRIARIREALWFPFDSVPRLHHEGERVEPPSHVAEKADRLLTFDGSDDELPPVPRVDPRVALIASERRARALFEGMEDSVFVHDLDGKILDANPAACRRLGYTREEFLQLNTREIDDPEFAAGYKNRLAEQMTSGHLQCEGRHRTKDGRVIPVEINTSTIVLEDRPVVLAVMRDISERKSLELARSQMAEAHLAHAQAIEAKNIELSQSEVRYRMLTEASLDAVVVADDQARITLFNRAAEDAFGYPISEVLNRPISLILHENLPGYPARTWDDGLRNRDPRVVGQTLMISGKRKNGETFPLEISLSMVETPEGSQFLGSIRDRTERQKMEAMLAQSEKLASIGLLSAGVAHEINNPLAFIGNNLAVLERDFAGMLPMIAAYEAADPILEQHDPSALAAVRAAREQLDWDYVRSNLGRMLTRTREGVGRVASIVQTLRGLARTSPPKKEPALLTDLVTSALELVNGRIRRGGINVVRNDPPQPLPPIPCVSSQISQVLINLMVNAVQALEEAKRPDGGTLTINVRREGSEQILEICDNAGGIEPDAIPRLFDPFYTTKPVGEGTGLGLSITHGIITGHGGRIEVDGRPGLGARFRVILPEASEEKRVPPPRI